MIKNMMTVITTKNMMTMIKNIMITIKKTMIML